LSVGRRQRPSTNWNGTCVAWIGRPRCPDHTASRPRNFAAGSLFPAVFRLAFNASSARGNVMSLTPARKRKSSFLRRSGVNCSVFGGWRDKFEVGFRHGFQIPLDINCLNNKHNSNSSDRAFVAVSISGLQPVEIIRGSTEPAPTDTLSPSFAPSTPIPGSTVPSAFRRFSPGREGDRLTRGRLLVFAILIKLDCNQTKWLFRPLFNGRQATTFHYFSERQGRDWRHFRSSIFDLF
jgi:hypothetical protein